MKTTRSNTFETNSSSTHAISLNLSRVKTQSAQPLISTFTDQSVELRLISSLWMDSLHAEYDSTLGRIAIMLSYCALKNDQEGFDRVKSAIFPLRVIFTTADGKEITDVSNMVGLTGCAGPFIECDAYFARSIEVKDDSFEDFVYDLHKGSCFGERVNTADGIDTWNELLASEKYIKQFALNGGFEHVEWHD